MPRARRSLEELSSPRTSYVVVGLERRTPAPLGPVELRAAYGLMPAEASVARLLGEGRSSKAIAAELCVTEHTARRHTERIFLKMNVSSRAEVVALVFS